jgi:hypothetical protein
MGHRTTRPAVVPNLNQHRLGPQLGRDTSYAVANSRDAKRCLLPSVARGHKRGFASAVAIRAHPGNRARYKAVILWAVQSARETY